MRHSVERTHDVVDSAQLPPQRAARMEAGEILRPEIAQLAQHQRQRIAHREHRRRARARRQAERAGFFELAQLDDERRRPADGARLATP